MKRILFLGSLLPLLLWGGTSIEKLSSQMTDLTPELRDHLTQVLQEISRTEDGKFLLEKISPEVSFSAKPMAPRGQANSGNEITMESLRLENKVFQDKTEAQKQIKICFSAEILAHELLHNAQFRAGLFRYPETFSGYEALLCEKWLELQAKYAGEKMFHVLRSREPFVQNVKPKAGLFLVMARRDGIPAEFARTLWRNDPKTGSGTPLFRPQIRECAQWNLAYAEQGFRNHYKRFLADLPGAGEEAFAAHLQKILDFYPLQVPLDFVLKNAPLRRIPHGIACYEAGQKVLELEAVPGGWQKRVFSGKTVRIQNIRFPRHGITSPGPAELSLTTPVRHGSRAW